MIIKTIFHEALYRPLYNALVYLIDIIPHADIGFALIILTLIVKVLLFPLSKKAIKTQLALKQIEQPLKDIKEQHKGNQQLIAQKTMEMYKLSNINPFAGIFLVLIQLPVVIALYLVFAHAGLPSINSELLYSFVSIPASIQTTFLGFIDLVSSHSLVIAILVFITQSFQIRLSLPAQSSTTPESKKQGQGEFSQEFMKGLHFQMKYILPVITAFISYKLLAVVGLYWIVGNIFSSVQEIYFKHTIKKDQN